MRLFSQRDLKAHAFFFVFAAAVTLNSSRETEFSAAGSKNSICKFSEKEKSFALFSKLYLDLQYLLMKSKCTEQSLKISETIAKHYIIVDK